MEGGGPLCDIVVLSHAGLHEHLGLSVMVTTQTAERYVAAAC